MLFRHRRNPDHRRQRSLPPWRYRVAGLAAAALALSFLQANVGNAAAERAAAEAAPKAAADVVRVAEFLAECPYTHRAPDDPIVFPGLPGASHMHSFFGNDTTHAGLTWPPWNGAVRRAPPRPTCRRTGYPPSTTATRRWSPPGPPSTTWAKA